MKNNTKYQNYLLGRMGEILARQMFTVTLPPKNPSHDFRLPIWQSDYQFKVEVKSCRPTFDHETPGYRFDYTKRQAKSDFFCVLLFTDNLELNKIYWIPGKKIPKRTKSIWIGRYSSKKWDKYRVI